MPKKIRFFILLAVLICAMLLAGAAMATSNASTFDWYVIGGGGGMIESGDGSININSTVAQPVAGVTSPDLCSGFWCGVSDWVSQLHIYLPLIIDN